MVMHAKIQDKADIERYLKSEPSISIPAMKNPCLKILLCTDPNDALIRETRYVLAELENIENAPEIKDNIHRVMCFLAGSGLPSFKTVRIHHSDMRIYNFHYTAQVYMRYTFKQGGGHAP